MSSLGAAFELERGDDIGVVLIHGFTGSPWDLRFLGDRLAAVGYSVVAPLLPGHNTTPRDLDATPWSAWVDAVDHAIARSARRCRKVVVIGQSLGGLLALHAASRRPEIAAVGSLATPLWLDGLAAKVAKWTQGGPLRWVRAIPKFGGPDIRYRAARRASPSYSVIPTRALGELLAFMPIVERALPAIRQPVIVLHARDDHTAPVACAARIAELTRATRVRILDRSYHLIANDIEREIVAREVTEFIATALTKEQLCAT